jgi:hypothetical protein
MIVQMSLQAQYTEADYREATSAVRSLGFTSISTAPYFYMILGLYLGNMLGTMLQRPYPGEPRASLPEVIVINLPYALMLGAWAIIIFRRMGRKAPAFLRPTGKLTTVGPTFPIVLAITTFLIALLANALQYPTPPPDPSKRQTPPLQVIFNLALAFGPMVALASSAILLFFVLLRQTIKRHWELQPNLLRPHQIDLDDESVTISDGTSQRAYRWSSFVGWHDTPNLLLLYRSYVSFEMIPKRSFATPQAAEFLGLLREKIGDLQRAFEPLRPSAMPPPLPHERQNMPLSK